VRIKLRSSAIKRKQFFIDFVQIFFTFGLVLVNTIQPGAALPEEAKNGLTAAYGQQAAEMQGCAKETTFGIQTLVNIVPRHPFCAMAGKESNNDNPDMLAVIFFALMVGVGWTLIKAERAQPLMRVLEAINDAAVVIINLAMKLAPFGVAGLIFSVTARFGSDSVKALAWYVVTVSLGLVLHQFGVFSLLVRFFARMNPLTFFKKIETIMLTAFSTSSSNVTLPTTIMVSQQNLGVDRILDMCRTVLNVIGDVTCAAYIAKSEGMS
jgi:DAACS family dicarboxylate/amino acid:cation (Na+ or H+) symporter